MNARANSLDHRLANLSDWKLAYRIDEACAAIGYGRNALFERIKEGRIVARKDGKFTLIERDELLRFIKSLPTTKAK
jgi:hypothetical protein